MNEPTNLIHNIRLTEKASLLREKNNQYVFRVDPRANKLQIKQAIEEIFGKKVVRVNTANTPGKRNVNAGPILAGGCTGRRRS